MAQSIPHASDRFLQDPSRSTVDEIFDVLEKTVNAIESQKLDTPTGIKFDGMGSIYFGIDPADKKFYIGTRTIGNKSPVFAKSMQDISSMYNAEQSELLRKVFPTLKNTTTRGQWMGDLLFTPTDIRRNKIDGKDHITFHPNSLVYAVPEDSETAKAITNARIGLAVHSQWKGSPSKGTHEVSSYLRNSPKFLKDSKFVWTPSQTKLPKKVSSSASKRELYNVKRKLKSAKKRQTDALRYVKEYKQFVPKITTYINQEIFAKGRDSLKSSDHKEFLQWHFDRYGSFPIIEKKGFDRIVDAVVYSQSLVKSVVDNIGVGNELQAYMPGPEGLTQFDKEGLVMRMPDGSLVKLVDRKGFMEDRIVRYRL